MKKVFIILMTISLFFTAVFTVFSVEVNTSENSDCLLAVTENNTSTTDVEDESTITDLTTPQEPTVGNLPSVTASFTESTTVDLYDGTFCTNAPCTEYTSTFIQPTTVTSTVYATQPYSAGAVITPIVKPTLANDVVPKLSYTKLTLKSGATKKLTIKNGKAKKWTSSSKNVVMVKNGKLTALQKGTSTIKVLLTSGKVLSCQVKVSTNPVIIKDSKKITSVTIKKNKTAKIKISGKAYSLNNKYTNTKYAKVTSKNTDSAIKIKGIKKGTTVLKIKVNGVKSLKLKVKVK